SSRAKIQEFPTTRPRRRALASPVEEPVTVPTVTGPYFWALTGEGRTRWTNEVVGSREAARRGGLHHAIAICGGGLCNGNTHLGADREREEATLPVRARNPGRGARALLGRRRSGECTPVGRRLPARRKRLLG